MNDYNFDPKFALNVLIMLWGKANQIVKDYENGEDLGFGDADKNKDWYTYQKGSRAVCEFVVAALFGLNTPEGIDKWLKDAVKILQEEDGNA